MTTRGCFVTLEGLEGVGKTTNLEFVVGFLREQGIDLLVTREPGGTGVGEAIRQVVLGGQHEISALAELLLIATARMEHVNTVIEPALARGQWVVSDRYLDASVAYQGGGRELGRDVVLQWHDALSIHLQPDLTLLLDMPVEAGLARMRERGEPDRIERESLAFFERARAGYLAQAEASPDRVSVINAAHPLVAVRVAVLDRLEEFLATRDADEAAHAR